MLILRLTKTIYFENVGDGTSLVEMQTGCVVLLLTEKPIRIANPWREQGLREQGLLDPDDKFGWWMNIFATSHGVVRRTTYKEEVLWGMTLLGIQV